VRECEEEVGARAAAQREEAAALERARATARHWREAGAARKQRWRAAGLAVRRRWKAAAAFRATLHRAAAAAAAGEDDGSGGGGGGGGAGQRAGGGGRRPGRARSPDPWQQATQRTAAEVRARWRASAGRALALAQRPRSPDRTEQLEHLATATSLQK
jgi:hypothetical protein